MNANIGTRLPALNVSLGQVLLSELDSDELAAYCASSDFSPRTPKSIASPQALERALAAIRTKGYAWVDGELDPAICGIAVPLRDRAGKIVAAINISLIAGAWSETKARKQFLAPMRHAAEQIRAAMQA